MPSLFKQPVPEQVSENTDKTEQLCTSFWAMHTEKVESLKKLIHIPAQGECTFIWTQNSFNAFTFIPFCIANFGSIDELYLSTYTINRRIADALFRQIDEGKIKKVSITVSESLKFRMPAVVEHIQAMMVNRQNVSMRFIWNHSKVACIRCDNNYFVFEGSGNWSENAQYEQYVLINSKEIYEFRKKNLSMVE